MHLEAIPQIMDLLQGSTTEVENSEKMVALGIAKFLENPTPTAATCLQAIAEFSRGENYGLEEEEQETETPPLTPHAKIWGEHLARLSEELIKIYDSKGEESEISALGCFDLLVIALDESCIEKIEASILVPLLERAQDCNEEQSLEYFGWIFAEIIKKLGPVAIQYTSKLVNMILKLVENESPECKESGYNLCTEVMQVCTPDRLSDCFSKIAPFVIQHMSCDDSETVMFAARFVGDSALALSALVSEKSDDYMMAAFKAFHNTKLEKDVKITLVRLIGDLALVMTDKFFKYVPAIIKEVTPLNTMYFENEMEEVILVQKSKYSRTIKILRMI